MEFDARTPTDEAISTAVVSAWAAFRMLTLPSAWGLTRILPNRPLHIKENPRRSRHVQLTPRRACVSVNHMAARPPAFKNLGRGVF